MWSTGKRPREDDTEDRGGRRKKNREEEQQVMYPHRIRNIFTGKEEKLIADYFKTQVPGNFQTRRNAGTLYKCSNWIGRGKTSTTNVGTSQDDGRWSGPALPCTQYPSSIVIFVVCSSSPALSCTIPSLTSHHIQMLLRLSSPVWPVLHAPIIDLS